MSLSLTEGADTTIWGGIPHFSPGPATQRATTSQPSFCPGQGACDPQRYQPITSARRHGPKEVPPTLHNYTFITWTNYVDILVHAHLLYPSACR